MTSKLTNKELIDLYTIAVAKYHECEMDDLESDRLELECVSLEGIGAKRGIFATMERIMEEITTVG